MDYHRHWLQEYPAFRRGIHFQEDGVGVMDVKIVRVAAGEVRFLVCFGPGAVGFQVDEFLRGFGDSAEITLMAVDGGDDADAVALFQRSADVIGGDTFP